MYYRFSVVPRLIGAPMTWSYDRPAVLGQLAAWAAGAHGDAPAVRFKRDGGWHDWSYAELAASVAETAAGLSAAGVGPGDRVALLSETRPEWTVVDLAIAAVDAVCVPVYATNTAEECEWVLADSGARMVVCEGPGHAERVASVSVGLPALAETVVIEPGDGSPHRSLEALRAAGRENGPAPEPAASPEQPTTIVYTSGTTGPPKGCVLSHRNWRTSLDAIEQSSTIGPGDTMYLYLPLAHLFARAIQLVALECGATLVYFGGDISQVVAELAEVRPTHLPSVPRLFEKAYSMVIAQTEDAGVSTEQAQQAVRSAVGGRVREALSGSAPIAAEILEFFDGCDVPIYEAYGMTESAALISSNLPGQRRVGTVGRPLPGVEVRIAGDGEVLARGDNVFLGYWNNPAATAETLVDGWLHTGDLGELDADGFLRITGRKKDLIICTAGKNLSPANVENRLRQSRWVSQAVMLGDRRPYPVALITLDPDEVGPWAARRGLPTDPAELAGRPEAHGLIAAVVDEVNSHYAPAEQVRRFAILPRELSQQAGELTPTMKIRRDTVAKVHSDTLDALYL
jgi:long-chain acyl-CoA synthetase